MDSASICKITVQYIKNRYNFFYPDNFTNEKSVNEIAAKYLQNAVKTHVKKKPKGKK